MEWSLTVHLKLVHFETGQVELALAPAQKRQDVLAAPRPRIRT